MDMSDVWKIYDREISETPMPSNTNSSTILYLSTTSTCVIRGISEHGLCSPMQRLLERRPRKVPHLRYERNFPIFIHNRNVILFRCEV